MTRVRMSCEEALAILTSDSDHCREERTRCRGITRDGALGRIVAGLGLLTAWRPRYVYSTLLVGVLVLHVVSDLTDHDATAASASFELIHPLVLVIVGAMCAVAVDVRRRAAPRREPTPPLLRVR